MAILAGDGASAGGGAGVTESGTGPMESRSVEIRFSDGETLVCTVAFSTAPPWRLVLAGAGLETQEYSGEDVFEALIALRLELEKRSAKLLCAGARPDVYPSGMSRSMGGGRKAYVTRMGSTARHGDLVHIFDPADASLVGSVAEQREFRARWAESIRAIADSTRDPE